MQPSARPLPANLSPRLFKRSSLPSSRLLCLALSGASSRPTVLERPLPATPAVGPLSSESAVPTLRRLRSISRLLRARQAAPLHSYRRAPHLPVRPSPLHGHCGDPTAIATSALLTHWQSRSLTRRLQASNPVSNRLQQLARAARRPAAE